jgi:hypothetical protein
VSYELELLALAIFFYLYDSSVLLYANEAVLTRDSQRAWSASAGWVGFVLAGRTLCVLNPFTPHRSAFRLSWTFDKQESGSSDLSWSSREQPGALSTTTLLAGAALFILLPLGMFTGLGSLAVIAAAILLYGSTIVALILAKKSGMFAERGRRHFLAFAFECLACPPFAVNLVRRLALAERIAEPLPPAACRLLNPERWALLKSHCVARVEDAMRGVPDDSPEHAALDTQRRRLAALA